MSEEDFLAAGFKAFSPSVLDRYATRLWQKRYRDGSDTMYFLNVVEYQHDDRPTSFEINAAYDGTTFWNNAVYVKAAVSQETAIADVERIGRELWDRLTPNYYERN